MAKTYIVVKGTRSRFVVINRRTRKIYSNHNDLIEARRCARDQNWTNYVQTLSVVRSYLR